MKIQSGQLLPLRQHSSAEARKHTPVILYNRTSHLNKALSQHPCLTVKTNTDSLNALYIATETSASDNI